MRRMIAALIIGLALGYSWGYGEGTDGKPSIATRTLDKFGASKMKQQQGAREKSLQEASKP
jgi:hypothetical protein